MTEPIQHFTDLRVWKIAHRLFLDLCKDVAEARTSVPGAVIAEQILRSAGSVGANIAEGFGRTQRKFTNALDISYGEANETEHWLYKLRDLNLIPEPAVTEHLRAVLGLEKMLKSLRAEILRNANAAREEEPDYALPYESLDSQESK
jgi:four helix bundle protein